MKLRDWLQENTKKLERAGIATARLDCLVLLGDALGKDKSWLLAHREEATVQGSTLYSLEEQIKRRIEHEPLAYIRGISEFYGRNFIVNSHTLEPRPETEAMIDLLQDVVESRKLKVESRKTPTERTISKNQQPKTEQDSSTMIIVDVGTGSGCIAITAQTELAPMRTYATDIDSQCLMVAKQNAMNHSVNISFFEGNLLEPLQDTLKKSDKIIILANLPYVPDARTINKAAMHEPSHAIFGGEDGLVLYRELFHQIESILPATPEYILTESLPTQHKELLKIAHEHSYSLIAQADFIQVFRRDT